MDLLVFYWPNSIKGYVFQYNDVRKLCPTGECRKGNHEPSQNLTV